MAAPVTLILGAVPWEIKPIIAALERRRSGKLRDYPFHEGRLGGAPVVTAITGVGKTNAAMIATLFIERFEPARLIFTGSAARLNPALRTGDVIIGRRTFHHDAGSWQEDGMLYRKIIGPVAGRATNYRFDADRGLLAAALKAAKTHESKIVTANGETYRPTVRAGLICAGDVFGMTAAKVADIRAKLNCDLVEMEGSAIGQVCTELHVPHLVIRGGSNRAQPSPGEDYKRLGQIAARQAAFFAMHLARSL
ncbi:MAG TPA: 5'-methylthioadenosine/S-adenosylhomocysteine nucleosidase [Opitutus sp.]|nr:5'-methylthioadenosine/S-adenosylhomocysteine nucleosidase [Opitutus sp.]